MKKINTSSSVHSLPTPKRVIKINSTYTEPPTFTKEQLNELQNSMQIALSAFSKVMNAQLTELRSTMTLVGEAINNFYTNPRTVHSAEYLGARGWCIDLDFAPRAIIEIYLEKPSSNQLNQYMFEYYNTSDTLDKMIKNLLACSKIEKWHSSIAQAYKAYTNKLYIASICTLTPVFEGILFEFWDDKWQKENERKTNATYLSKQLLNECNTEKDFIKYLTLLSLNKVIKKFYNSHTVQFTIAKTQEHYKFNRHGIVHGRMPMENNVYDVLKLFNYIASIVAFL